MKQIDWRFIFENLTKKDKAFGTINRAEVIPNLIADNVSL